MLFLCGWRKVGGRFGARLPEGIEFLFVKVGCFFWSAVSFRKIFRKIGGRLAEGKVVFFYSGRPGGLLSPSGAPPENNFLRTDVILFGWRKVGGRFGARLPEGI